ncbi:MAG: HPr kinase/phosphatase C-terminal domain-containing protein [Kordiimonadaceae bacterium]|nr:HPr kinase/phosphatase C-terminal domain-containing protein [Kordiimonadaceae bacterium]
MAMVCHATVVDIGGRGVLLRGPSGCGKSDLALRLMDRGATLVADDQTVLEKDARGVLATAPAALRGFIEVRGLGIISAPVTGSSFIALVVDLVAESAVERLPEKLAVELFGKEIPRILLNAFEISTPIKIELAVEDASRIGNVGPNEQNQ